MTPGELQEAIGLYARWLHAKELKLTKSEIFWLRHRLKELGIKLP